MSFRKTFNNTCKKFADFIGNLGTVRTIIRKNGVNVESTTVLSKDKYVEEQEALGFEVISYAGKLVIKQPKD